jgi:hypothetical protein
MDKVIIGQRYMTDRLLIGLLCNGHILLEGVPGLAKTLAIKTLAQVVDVSLAFFLFTTGLMIAFHIFFMGRALANGEGYLGLYIAVIAVLTALLPFASVLGFTVYGWFVKGDWTTTSTVYQWYVGLFGSGYQWLESRIGDVLGLMVVETDAKGVDVTKVDTDMLVQWAQISAAAIAIVEFVLRRTARTV